MSCCIWVLNTGLNEACPDIINVYGLTVSFTYKSSIILGSLFSSQRKTQPAAIPYVSIDILLAHLSLKYTHGPASVVVRRTSSVRRPQCSNIFFSETAWPIKSQILCGASLGRGNEILFTASGSRDQDGCHAHIW